MKKLLTLFVFVLAAMSAWAQDTTPVTLQDDADGTKYVNMPKTGTNTLTLTDGSVTTFKVYDNGGKLEDPENAYVNYYSGSCDGYLVITVPAGKRLQVAGTIITEQNYDCLTIYDGAEADVEKQLFYGSSNPSYEPTIIGFITSTGNSLTLRFNSDSSGNRDGLDLFVDVFDPNAQQAINIDAATGGTMTSNVATAKFGDVITLIDGHDEGYVLESVKVVDTHGNELTVTGGTWYDIATSFTMPATAVTVTPTYLHATTAEEGLFLNMPKEGTFVTHISTGIKSFKIYDDGGKLEDPENPSPNYYSSSCNGAVVVNAPEGLRLQVTGTITTETPYDPMTIYDGAEANDEKQLFYGCSEPTSYAPTNIGVIASTENALTIRFVTDGSGQNDGLDLIVDVFDPNAQQAITIETATGGTMTSSVATAKFGDIVNLNDGHDMGYVLESLKVVDAHGNDLTFTGGTWYDVATSFTMPATAVTVTPKFLHATSAEEGLYLNMPKTGTVNVQLSTGIKSFKVYDDGGKLEDPENAYVNYYSSSCDGYLVITAPIGYRLELTGTITSEQGFDYLTVYDGTEANDEKLLFHDASNPSYEPTDIGTWTSSARSMTLRFNSDGGGQRDGLDLTVTLVPITYTLAFDNGKAGATGTMDITGTMESITLTYDAPQNLPAVGFSRTAYDFTGWALTATGEVKYADKAEVENLATEQDATVTLYGKWTPIVYPITYDLAGGALAEGVTNPVEYTIESANFTLKNPTRRGYNFAGWTGTDLTEATKTVTVTTGHYGERSYTATWTPIIYNITYDLKGGEVATANPATYTIESGAIKLNNPTRTGYTFKGWTGTDLTVATVEVTIPAESIGDRSYVATWEANPYKVSFDANGGDGGTMADQNFVYDAAQNLTANAFTRTGYIFTGWNSKADGTGTPYDDKQEVENLTATRDAVVTMYAQWQPIIYYVAFDKNGGTGTDMMVQKFIYDTAQELFENAYTRKGYNFDGWNSKANGSGTPYTDKQSVKNLSATQDEVVTLYAQWNAITYTISYDLDGGSVATANPESYTIETAAFTLNNPTRTGYTFKGWKGTDIDGATMTVTIAKGSTGNREYTATWERNAITLVDDADNSDLLTTWNGIVADVTLSGRTFSKNNQWNTICLPFDLTIAGSVLDGAEVRTLENSSLSELNLTLTFSAPVTEIEAGKPYVIKWTSGEPLENPKFEGVTVKNVKNSVMTGDVEFIGTYAPTALAKDDVTNLYLGSNNTLYYPNVDGFKVNAFRAYFKVSDSLGAMGFNIIADFGDGSTTRIQNIESTGSAADSWYTLNGVKLNGKPTQKGVFIHNGKKEIVK